MKTKGKCYYCGKPVKRGGVYRKLGTRKHWFHKYCWKLA